MWPALAAIATDYPPDGCGVYFLIRDDQIVYVGSSAWPGKRVWTHSRCRKKSFSDAVFVPVPENVMLAEEAYWIRTIRPVHNGVHNPAGSADPWG